MDSKNKKIIYAVVGIMVLVIMIVGSTVAYLSLSGSNTDIITGNMATVGFNLSVKKVTNVDDEVGLIPMSNNLVESALSSSKVCVDDNGNAVCQIYKISINNTSKSKIMVDGYVTLTGGSGESVDYPGYKYNTEKTTMRWAQASCTGEGNNLTSCTTAGSTTVGTSDNIVFDKLGGDNVLNDYLAREEIKDSKKDVIQGTRINGSIYDVINTNYIRVSDHGIDNNNYSQDKDVTSALVYNQYLDSSSSQNYYIVVWLSENNQNQTKEDGDNFFNGKVTFVSSEGSKITAKFGEEEDTLYSKIQESAYPDDGPSEYVKSKKGIDFSKISSDENGKGVYQLSSTRSNDYPIYYYRGAVTNNNVKFAKFCWKIVRTTETGGVKLIYNGEPDENGGCTNITGDETQLAETKSFNSSHQSPADVGYMYGTRYEQKSRDMSINTTNYMYGKTVSYEGGTYTLETTKTGIWSELYNGGLNSNHYTCFSENNTCSTVNYIYYANESTAYYIELTGGKKVEDALKEMTSESTNEHDSTIKEYIDSWYGEHMTGYTKYLEDTVWCNNRSISYYAGWNLDGEDITDSSYLNFLSYTRYYIQENPSLICSNDNDKFTVDGDNGNGKLTYPVGLLTIDEVMYAGGTKSRNSDYYLYTNKNWWTLSPSDFRHTFAVSHYVNWSGYLSSDGVYSAGGVRPSISLKLGTKIIKGNGSQSAPFEILTTS